MDISHQIAEFIYSSAILFSSLLFCFLFFVFFLKVLLRDWRGRPLERCRSATNFGLTVTYQLKRVIPYGPSENNNSKNSNSKICTHSSGSSSFYIHESPAAVAGEIRFYNRPLHLLKGEHARDLLASVIYGELNESKSNSSSSGSISDGDYGDSNPGSSSSNNNNTCGGGRGGASRAGCNNMLELPLIGYIARKRKEGEPCGFDVGFYICLMDRYSHGADTLVFEFSVKLGSAHISGSPFTLNFFNPLLP